MDQLTNFFLGIMNQITDILLNTISLENRIYYSNLCTETYDEMNKKTAETYNAIKNIWWTTNQHHYYSEYLGKTTWVYEPVQHLLWNLKEDTLQSHTLKRLPWLSAEVYYGSTLLEDCSVWVSDLHYRDYGNVSQGDKSYSLTVDVIFQAWATSKNHVINYGDIDAYKFEVIDEEGNDKTYKMGDCAI
jgi:hypothetical protein